MEENRDMRRFMEMPVFKAVCANALPAMAAMVMVLLYNLADTFFIGRTNDPYQVAAISLCTPIFSLSLSIGTVFGIGGTSLISRLLGERNDGKAKNACSFCFWGGCVSGFALMLIILIFNKGLLKLMGASESTIDFARSYLLIVAFCCPFSVIANSYNNILRAEGKSKEAMGGQIIGNLINIVLDPIFISVFKMGIAGAAVATVLGNAIGALYYIRFYTSGKAFLSIKLKDFAMKDGIASEIFAIGVPAAVGSFLISASQITANKLMLAYSDLAVAAYGVAGKIIMIAGTFCIGLGQGVQPLMGFCYGAKNKDRFKEFMRVSLIFALVLGTAMSGLIFLFRIPVIHAFLQESQTVEYAGTFLLILLTTSSLVGVFTVLVSILQAMGKALASLIVNVSRQGLIFIPSLFILSKFLGVNGIVWSQPVSDVVSLVLGFAACLKAIRNFPESEISSKQEK